ncbi:hypothetical protein OE88DRAFT_1644752 [Heliocybe sulcata]|uniref:Uncharacterized protein n=1 Tax=Heliocybe sulcata TaxID=5364 RepID=A0A5C3N2H0_9AGAM|nr:hypothetical protein OE88DRAFT_1644752 [Heliocybe sulcata]
MVHTKFPVTSHFNRHIACLPLGYWALSKHQPSVAAHPIPQHRPLVIIPNFTILLHFLYVNEPSALLRSQIRMQPGPCLPLSLWAAINPQAFPTAYDTSGPHPSLNNTIFYRHSVVAILSGSTTPLHSCGPKSECNLASPFSPGKRPVYAPALPNPKATWPMPAPYFIWGDIHKSQQDVRHKAEEGLLEVLYWQGNLWDYTNHITIHCGIHKSLDGDPNEPDHITASFCNQIGKRLATCHYYPLTKTASFRPKRRQNRRRFPNN